MALLPCPCTPSCPLRACARLTSGCLSVERCARLSLVSGAEQSALWDWAACTVTTTCWTWTGTLSGSATSPKSSWPPWETFCECPAPLPPPHMRRRTLCGSVVQPPLFHFLPDPSPERWGPSPAVHSRLRAAGISRGLRSPGLPAVARALCLRAKRPASSPRPSCLPLRAHLPVRQAHWVPTGIGPSGGTGPRGRGRSQQPSRWGRSCPVPCSEVWRAPEMSL